MVPTLLSDRVGLPTKRDSNERGHGVTRLKSGVTIAVKKRSRVALLKSNTTKVNSPTRGSRPDNVYIATNTGGTCKA